MESAGASVRVPVVANLNCPPPEVKPGSQLAAIAVAARSKPRRPPKGARPGRHSDIVRVVDRATGASCGDASSTRTRSRSCREPARPPAFVGRALHRLRRCPRMDNLSRANATTRRQIRARAKLSRRRLAGKTRVAAWSPTFAPARVGDLLMVRIDESQKPRATRDQTPARLGMSLGAPQLFGFAQAIR